MNLKAGGDRVRSLGWFGSPKHFERRSFLLTTFASFCADIMIVKVTRKKRRVGTLCRSISNAIMYEIKYQYSPAGHCGETL